MSIESRWIVTDASDSSVFGGFKRRGRSVLEWTAFTASTKDHWHTTITPKNEGCEMGGNITCAFAARCGVTHNISQAELICRY
jgi:hypothetical protein